MPDNNTEYYENEVSEGKNLRSVKCKYCSSVILTPASASFTSFEVRNDF